MASDGSLVGLHHIGLQVRDVDRSSQFYRTVVGLVQVERQVRADQYLQDITGYPGVSLDIALMLDEATGCIVELLEYRGVEGNAVDPATANPGTAHVCFEVADVDASYARAIKGGYSAVSSPVTPTSGRWIGGRSVYLLDPDRIRVELVQRARPNPTDAAAKAHAPLARG